MPTLMKYLVNISRVFLYMGSFGRLLKVIAMFVEPGT